LWGATVQRKISSIGESQLSMKREKKKLKRERKRERLERKEHKGCQRAYQQRKKMVKIDDIYAVLTAINERQDTKKGLCD